MGQSTYFFTRLRVNIRISNSTWHTRRYSSFVQAATDPSNTSQVYISRSLDPFLNLSIEHHLLQKTPANSTILFLYTNRECIVIGRNQNPWVETHLKWLRNNPGKCDLVRRRSGGGTVFHDEGNVNYSVICPTADFHRDKHAEMVVRALHKLGVKEARVNQRHDIVVDRNENRNTRTLKVSGSAYKLTRLRSLHHGTCLLSSPNIGQISSRLQSPARPFIKARGVDSVKSPVANVNVSNKSFEEAVCREFGSMYGSEKPVVVGSSLQDVPEIRKGMEELRSEDWTYGQTPPFTFSTHDIDDETEEDRQAREYMRESLPREYRVPDEFKFKLDIRHGAITEAHNEELNKTLQSKVLHEIDDWRSLVRDRAAGQWMNTMLRTNKIH